MKQTIYFIILVFIFVTSCASAGGLICETSPLVKGKCFTVYGTLYSYDGWPPYLRIESKDKKLYGVGPPENELIPQSIQQVLPTKIEGEFEVCPFDETTLVPYEEREIEMVCIKSVRNAWYWDRNSGEKKELK